MVLENSKRSNSLTNNHNSQYLFKSYIQNQNFPTTPERSTKTNAGLFSQQQQQCSTLVNSSSSAEQYNNPMMNSYVSSPTTVAANSNAYMIVPEDFYQPPPLPPKHTKVGNSTRLTISSGPSTSVVTGVDNEKIPNIFESLLNNQRTTEVSTAQSKTNERQMSTEKVKSNSYVHKPLERTIATSIVNNCTLSSSSPPTTVVSNSSRLINQQSTIAVTASPLSSNSTINTSPKMERFQVIKKPNSKKLTNRDIDEELTTSSSSSISSTTSSHTAASISSSSSISSSPPTPPVRNRTINNTNQSEMVVASAATAACNSGKQLGVNPSHDISSTVAISTCSSDGDNVQQKQQQLLTHHKQNKSIDDDIVDESTVIRNNDDEQDDDGGGCGRGDDDDDGTPTTSTNNDSQFCTKYLGVIVTSNDNNIDENDDSEDLVRNPSGDKNTSHTINNSSTSILSLATSSSTSSFEQLSLSNNNINMMSDSNDIRSNCAIHHVVSHANDLISNHEDDPQHTNGVINYCDTNSSSSSSTNSALNNLITQFESVLNSVNGGAGDNTLQNKQQQTDSSMPVDSVFMAPIREPEMVSHLEPYVNEICPSDDIDINTISGNNSSHYQHNLDDIAEVFNDDDDEIAMAHDEDDDDNDNHDSSGNNVEYSDDIASRNYLNAVRTAQNHSSSSNLSRNESEDDELDSEDQLHIEEDNKRIPTTDTTANVEPICQQDDTTVDQQSNQSADNVESNIAPHRRLERVIQQSTNTPEYVNDTSNVSIAQQSTRVTHRRNPLHQRRSQTVVIGMFFIKV